MSEEKEAYYSLGDFWTIAKSFTQYLLRKCWVLLLGCCLGIGIAIAYYNIQKPKYEALTTFILEEKSPGGSGLAGLASQFGFDLSALGGSSNLFAGDNILEILRSKAIVQKVLLSRLNRQSDNSPTLGDLYLDFSKLKKDWSKYPSLAGISFNSNSPVNQLQDSVLNIIYTRIIKKNLAVDRINKKGSIVRVQVTAPNMHFAKLMADRLVEEASKMYLEIKTGTAMANINRMQHRSDSLLALLNNRSYVAAAAQPLDINPGLKTAAVSGEIASRDKAVIATLYTEITKNLEASKMILSQQTPVIQILDRTVLSIFDNKKGLVLLIIAGILVSGFISVVSLLIKFMIDLKQK